MDIFGIYQAMKGAVLIYFRSARGTGRTLSMVEALKEGDRVAFTNPQEADRVRRLCKQRGFDIEALVFDTPDIARACNHGPPKGRFVFDHSWVEQYYLNAIEKAGKDIEYLQKSLSGPEEGGVETEIKVKEEYRWKMVP